MEHHVYPKHSNLNYAQNDAGSPLSKVGAQPLDKSEAFQIHNEGPTVSKMYMLQHKNRAIRVHKKRELPSPTISKTKGLQLDNSTSQSGIYAREASVNLGDQSNTESPHIYSRKSFIISARETSVGSGTRAKDLSSLNEYFSKKSSQLHEPLLPVVPHYLRSASSKNQGFAAEKHRNCDSCIEKDKKAGLHIGPPVNGLNKLLSSSTNHAEKNIKITSRPKNSESGSFMSSTDKSREQASNMDNPNLLFDLTSQASKLCLHKKPSLRSAGKTPAP